MTRRALANDRGLQPERTVLAWTRTSLAVVVTGGLLLLKDRQVAGQHEHPERIAVGAGAATIAFAVYLVGVRRRRALTVKPPVHSTARGQVIATGAAVMTLAGLGFAYLLLPLL
jgi:uncharacterized membrane protein YidH (DUF202 family)